MRSSFHCMNNTQQVNPASQTGTASDIQAPAKKMTQAEVEYMLTEYVRDATLGELRAEVKKRMLDCYHHINRFNMAFRSGSDLQTLDLRTPENSELVLDLTLLGLTKLPGDLSFLNGVKAINVAHNDLEELPESIGSIHSLEKLDICNNAIKVLPNGLSRLVNLIELKAARNKLGKRRETFGPLASLKNLLRCQQELHVSHEWIGSMVGLKKLDLSQNQHFLPESIGDLTRLESLNISLNELEKLPESIGKLSNLTQLLAFNNKLESLPDSFCQLSNLTRLDLIDNRFSEIPCSINQLVKLAYLDMSGNRVVHLPDSISSLVSLVEFNLSSNQLQTLPESIGTLQSLLTLNLNGNRLTELPESIVRLPTDCVVRLSMSSLSRSVLEQVNPAIVEHRTQHPEQGPTIEFNMAVFNQTFNVIPLQEEIDSWRAQGGLSSRNEQHPQLKSAIQQLTHLESEALSTQLGRMRLTAHYLKAPADLVQRVNKILNYIQKNPDVLQTCAAIAVEGTETCNDRIALAFIELEEAIINHQSLNEPNLAKLVNTASSLHISQLLKNIAQEKVLNLRGFVDPTEIILKYVVNLSKEFSLPSQLNDMIFRQCALQVSEADIQHAREEVQKQSSSENLNTFLATWQPWRKALSEQYPAEYAQVQANAEKRQEKIHQKMDKLTDRLTAAKARYGDLSTQYLDLIVKSNALKAQYRDIETTEFAKLTQEVTEVVTTRLNLPTW